jgi:hypothetical protein
MVDFNHVQNIDGRSIYVDPITGGRKGVKAQRYDLIPPALIAADAHHYGFGSGRYADRNWELGYPVSLSFAAAMRHAWDWWSGEDADEDGQHNLIAARWHLGAAWVFTTDGRDTYAHLDDRPHR